MTNNLTYILCGDYCIPNLSFSDTEAKPLGKYGRMRKTYLKEHRPILWNTMILSETLYPHLHEIDETAHRRAEQIMAANPDISEAAANALAEKFKSQNAQAQVDMANKHSEDIQRIMQENAAQQNATMQQMMQMISELELCSMQAIFLRMQKTSLDIH